MKKIFKLYLTLCLLVAGTAKLNAQIGPDLLLSAGGTGSDIGRSIAYDVDGNKYVCGSFEGTAFFGSTSLVSSGGNDIFLTKYNNSGVIQWVRRAGKISDDFAYGVAVDGTDVYITGSFNGTANFNTPSATGSNEITSAGDSDIFLAKYNSNGDFQWAKRAGGTGSDAAYGLAVSGTDVYITGSFNGTANFNTPTATGSNEITSAGESDIFLAKYNSNGDFQWARRAGGVGIDAARGIAVSGAEVYITGSFNGGISQAYGANFNNPSAFGSNQINSAGSSDIFLAQYNSSGVFQWAKRAGASDGDIAFGVAVSGTEVYITGYFKATANFNTPSATGSNELVSAGNNEIFLAKYNSSGVFQWARRAGGTDVDVAYVVAVSGTEVYITGSFQNTANFNTPSATGSNEITYAGGVDIFLAKYNSGGVFQWARRAGGTGADIAYGAAVSGTEVYITGLLNNTANFNTPSATGSNELTSLSGSTDIFIALYGCVTPAPSGSTTQTFCNSATVANLSATGTDLMWYDASTSGNLLASTTALANGTNYYASQTVSTCESATRLQVTVTINASPSNTVTQTGNTLTANETGAAYQWLDCDNGNAPILGATNQSFTASDNGNYAVIITKNGCTVTSACATVNNVGITDFNVIENLLYYPNPTQGNFTIDLGNNFESFTMKITNTLGQVIQKSNYTHSKKIDIQIDGEKGIYFVEIRTLENITVIKVLKN